MIKLSCAKIGQPILAHDTVQAIVEIIDRESK